MTPATSAFVSHSMSLRGLEMPFLLFVVKMCCAQNRKKYQVEKGNLTHTSSWWRFIPERGCRELPYLVKLLVLCVYPPATWKKPTANSPSSCFYKRICWFFVSSFSPKLVFSKKFSCFYLGNLGKRRSAYGLFWVDTFFCFLIFFLSGLE
jgi:hypothetical protein